MKGDIEETAQFSELWAQSLKSLGFDKRFIEEYTIQKMQIRDLRDDIRELHEQIKTLKGAAMSDYKTYTLGEIAYLAYVADENATPFDKLSEPMKQIWQNVGHRVAASVGRADATTGEAEF